MGFSGGSSTGSNCNNLFFAALSHVSVAYLLCTSVVLKCYAFFKFSVKHLFSVYISIYDFKTEFRQFCMYTYKSVYRVCF